MPVIAQYRTFKEYAGFVVKGAVPVPVPAHGAPHIIRAAYVLSQMEAAKYGTVQSYDGCGISAGPLHAIAVSPSTKKQGALWGLIATLFEHLEPGDDTAVDELRTFLSNRDAIVSPAGVLVGRSDSKAVTGEFIREHLLATPQGKVPPSGLVHNAALSVALLFNRVFSSPQTFKAQEAFTVRWLLKGNADAEARAYSKFSTYAPRVVDVPNFLTFASQTDLGLPTDLAMCVYHAFTVNGPASAAVCLSQALTEKKDIDFAKVLVRKLGTSSYGRWRDTTDGANRYDKTRKVIEALPYWPVALVQQVMPENL